jgi:hypothetical protein
MHARDALNLALEGLEEGYRVIARALNLALEIRCKQLCFAVERRSTDSLASARSKMRASLPKIMHIDPLRFAEYQPWTLGYIVGLKDRPANISLVGGYSGEVSDAIDFLRKMELWTEVQWRELILEPVEKHHSKWVSLLNELSSEKGDSGEYSVAMTVSEWEKLLGFSARHFLRLRQEDKIRAKKEGNRIRCHKDDIRKYKSEEK